MANGMLCTRRDFERAKHSILRLLQDDGIASRRQLSKFTLFGITYEAIELALRQLQANGTVEELYSLPKPSGKSGVRKEYLALTVALDTRAVELPEGVVRVSKALEMIADSVEAEA